VAQKRGPRCGTSSSLSCVNMQFSTVSFFVALYGFIFLIARCICSSVMLVKVHRGGGIGYPVGLVGLLDLVGERRFCRIVFLCFCCWSPLV
jgi:hypothetical protein